MSDNNDRLNEGMENLNTIFNGDFSQPGSGEGLSQSVDITNPEKADADNPLANAFDGAINGDGNKSLEGERFKTVYEKFNGRNGLDSSTKFMIGLVSIGLMVLILS